MTDRRDTTAMILAAGVGSRFRSRTPKVVHPLLGRPLVAWPVAACRDAGITDVVVVVSPETEAAVAGLPGDLRLARQPRPLGTGDAARCGFAVVAHDGVVVVAAGDTPCLPAAAIRELLAVAAGGEIAVLTCVLDDPSGYGRIVRADDGSIAAIVEDKDATPAQRNIREINSGLYAFPASTLRRFLPELRPNNAQAELYLVDVIALARAAGIVARPLDVAVPADIQGVNDRAQLAAAERELARRQARRWQLAGVTVHAPETVTIEAGVELAADVEIGPGVQLLGRTTIGAGSRVGQGCVLRDVTLGENCEIKPYVVAEGARVADGGAAGPFAHLREGTVLGEGSRIGNFVETKKATLGRGSKANHLTYLGDAEIGANVNVGAGTITCNYDGANKHLTVIEDDVFIGSDTQLVAPVRVGKGATVGAGTTVTRDVEPGALSVSRAPQKDIAGYKRKSKKS